MYEIKTKPRYKIIQATRKKSVRCTMKNTFVEAMMKALWCIQIDDSKEVIIIFPEDYFNIVHIKNLKEWTILWNKHINIS